MSEFRDRCLKEAEILNDAVREREEFHARVWCLLSDTVGQLDEVGFRVGGYDAPWSFEAVHKETGTRWVFRYTIGEMDSYSRSWITNPKGNHVAFTVATIVGDVDANDETVIDSETIDSCSLSGGRDAPKHFVAKLGPYFSGMLAKRVAKAGLV
jgi:hypothetical protein